MATDNTSVWNINTDIYDIVESIENVNKNYIEDESEETLALGIFGFITDTEAKKIQTATIMAGEMGNEMFPTRAKLTKNVITHAIYNNITDINAVPATMTINMGIKVDDLNAYMVEQKFVIDSSCPLFIEQYEFHFDYDIIIQRSETNTPGVYSYSAHYDMTEHNNISDITEPYLKQPFTIRIGDYYYVVFQATIRQYTIEETTDKIISESIIENKTFTFEFDNQLVDFDVYITYNDVTTRLRPLLYGSDRGTEENYCWYLFVSDNTVRISLDSASYIPGINSDILIRAYTTLGEGGNFTYKNIDSEDAGMYIDISSQKYNYNTITCYAIAATNSEHGSNRKSKEELQKLIPKMAHSRGSITTEKDLYNYFDLINTEDNRLIVQKKVDNQISRIYYAYFLLKQENKDVMPTNTVDLSLTIDDSRIVVGDDGRYILPAGTVLEIDTSGNATIVDDSVVPPIYTDEFYADNKFYYLTIYDIIINPNPLYAAYYLSSSYNDQYFSFNWVNENTILQYVTNKCNFSRGLLVDQTEYKLKFKTAQSIAQDFGLVEVDEEGHIISNKTKAIVVFYKNDIPYRWKEATLVAFDNTSYVSSWELTITTDNGFDTENNIKIDPMHVAGYQTDMNYGYFQPNTKTVVYLLGDYDEQYGRHDIDTIVAGYAPDYTVSNIYNIEGGLDLYINFTKIINTRVINDSGDQYTLYSIPVVGYHYATQYADETNIIYLLNAIKDKRNYILECLKVLENNMDIDLKFFNTYGPSITYTTESGEPIGHIDLVMNFKAKMKSASDVYTKEDLVRYIKNYIENLEDIGDLHIPNLITDITNEFSDRIVYIEFVNFNDFGLGEQHILQIKNQPLYTVPEFLNIRNQYNDAQQIIPSINIEVLY